MTSQPLGADTSVVEVVHISQHGLWLNVKGTEYFLSYDDYPWFRDATVAQIHRVELLHGYHLTWPDLDVDLDVGTLENPERFPLMAKTHACNSIPPRPK